MLKFFAGKRWSNVSDVAMPTPYVLSGYPAD